MDRAQYLKAQALIDGSLSIQEALADAALPELLYELRIHQIELQLQNEELRQAQSALEEAKEKYADYYQLAPVGYVTLDERGVVQEANLTTRHILGIPSRNLVDKPFLLHLHSDYTLLFTAHLQDVFKHDRPFTVDMRLRGEPPTYVRLESKPVTQNGLRCCWTILTDVTDARATQESLERRTRQFNEAQQAAQIGSWWRDHATGEEEWSDELYHLLGYEPGSAAASHSLLLQHIHPDDRPLVRESLIPQPQHVDIEIRYIPFSGELRYARFINRAKMGAHPQEHILFGTFQDITDQKIAHENLAFLSRSAEQLMHLTDVGSVLAYTGEQLNNLLHEAIIIINRSISSEHESSVQGVYGADAQQVAGILGFSPVDKPYFMEPELIALFREGRMMRYGSNPITLLEGFMPASHARRFAGRFYLGQSYLIGLQNEDTFFAGIQIFMRGENTIADFQPIEAFVRQAVTVLQRITAEDQVRQSEKDAKALLNAIPDMIVRMDRHGRALSHKEPQTKNDGHWMVLDGGSINACPAPGLPELMQQHLRQTLDSGVMQVFDYLFESAQGVQDFEIRMFPSGGDDVMVIIRDVTERKAIQKRELEVRFERERVHILTHFIQSASHEFRTPLTIIGSNIYLMTRAPGTEKSQIRAQQALEQIERITRLLDMLHQVSSLEGRETLDLKPLALYEIVEGVCADMKTHYPDGLTCECAFEPDLPKVMGQSAVLFEAIRQVADNACRYTPLPGTVHMDIRREQSHILLTICDSGAGIAAEDLPYIFETFWRKDTAHTTHGFGVGLSIAKRIIDLHHGRIEIASEIGKGTQVSLRLPAQL
jgi:signal transduction histidine kinase